jgi:hypothetical protein
MNDDCGKKSSPEGDTVLWGAAALLLVSLLVTIFL